MNRVDIITADEAAKFVEDGQNIVTGGFVGSCCPEALTKALEKRFLESGHPKNLNLYYAAAQGNRDGSGADHFAHKGMTKRVVSGHWNMAPKLGEMAVNNEIEAYNLPQGTISQLFRDIAGKRIGTITHVGLNTFVDPRQQGGRLNSISEEDVVELINIKGKELLLYKAFPIDICFIRGSYADEAGNVTLEREVASLEGTSIAQACHNSGGKVIVQVEKIVRHGSLDPRLVKIPHIYVDAVVIAKPEEHEQCFGHAYESAFTGSTRIPVASIPKAPLNARKVIARRAAMELRENSVVNLGIGIPEVISMVANEEGIGDFMIPTVEAGAIGGVPAGGSQFGASINPDCILDQPYQFDFYDGGGVDLAFLGFAQIDRNGNIDVSKFGPRIAGCGGFINITQNAKKVFFCGTFTAQGLKETVENGRLRIAHEGASKKLLNKVEQITFNGDYANKIKQPVMYITERAVFKLFPDGMHLIEIAPGIRLKEDVLDLMDFKPIVEGDPKIMDECIFDDKPMNLKSKLTN